MTNTDVLGSLSSKLREEIITNSSQIDVAKGTEVMHEGQYINSIPILIKGLVRVYSRHEDKELLLYYIKPSESCIMTIDSVLNNKPSRVYASTEEDSTVMLMPVEKIAKWMKQYPEMNQLFFRQYNVRYTELIAMINQILFERMDKRLYDYLKSKSAITGQNPVQVSHRQIANDLGTAREVITRVVKKLETDNRVKQDVGKITVLDW